MPRKRQIADDSTLQDLIERIGIEEVLNDLQDYVADVSDDSRAFKGDREGQQAWVRLRSLVESAFDVAHDWNLSERP